MRLLEAAGIECIYLRVDASLMQETLEIRCWQATKHGFLAPLLPNGVLTKLQVCLTRYS